MVNKVRVFEYLEALRESGITNMFGATPYIERVFDVWRNNGSDKCGNINSNNYNNNGCISNDIEKYATAN